MRINTNKWNKIRYSFYSPIYDFIASFSKHSRQKSISKLGIKHGEKVLIVGAGTGLDLEHLPNGCEITATDITPSMVKRITKRNERLKHNLVAKVMDGHKLEFDDDSFDYVILHLILAVIPNPNTCLIEASRVLKSEGVIAVYDKFASDEVSIIRKIMNVFANFFFSNINRNIHKIVSSTELEIASNTPADLNGLFRIIKLKKS